MTERQVIEDLLEELYAARMRGDLDAVARLFAANATFQVAGTDDASPMPTFKKTALLRCPPTECRPEGRTSSGAQTTFS